MRTRRGRGGREGTRGRHIRGEGWGRGSGETKTGRKALASTDRTSKGKQAGSVLSKEDGSQNCRLSDAAPRATFCLPAALPAFSGPRPHGLRSQNAAGRDLAQDRPGSCRRARAMWENLLLRDRGRWREASGFLIPQGESPPAQWEEPCVGLSRLPSFPLPEIDSLRISLPDGDFRVIHVPILTPTPKIWSEKRHPGTRESGGFLTAPPSRLSLTRPASRNGDPAQPRATLSAARLPPRTRPR